MEREELQVEDLGIASVETRGDIVGEPELVTRFPAGIGISED